MEKKKIIRFVESFVLLPIVTVSIPFGNIPKINPDTVNTPQIIVSSQKENIEPRSLFAFNQVIDDKENQEKEDQILKVKADAIDSYFKEHDMPLEGLGMKMVVEAEKNDIDWRLLPAISVIESTGGKFSCKKVENSFFGWGSCKIGFKTKEEAIEIVAKNLGGNNPKTAKHYDGKTTEEILKKYNSIIPTYTQKIFRVMNLIGDADVVKDTKVNS